MLMRSPLLLHSFYAQAMKQQHGRSIDFHQNWTIAPTSSFSCSLIQMACSTESDKECSEINQGDNRRKGRKERRGGVKKKKQRFTAFPKFAYVMNDRKSGRTDDTVSSSDQEPLNTLAQSEATMLSPDLFEQGADLLLAWDNQSKSKSRLQKNRSYARKEAFTADCLNRPPTLSDILPPSDAQSNPLWIGTPFHVAVAILAYLIFPFMTETLSKYVTDSPRDLSEITATFLPSISIVYGTFVSLTLSILYNRQSKVQEIASLETSLLSMLTGHLLMLFHDEKENAIDVSQCVADQVRCLIDGSRGSEIMRLIYSDPYAKVLEFVADKAMRAETEQNGNGVSAVLIGSIKDICKDLAKVRSQRLSFEALALPATHFFVLVVLSSLVLLAFILKTISSSGGQGAIPSNESAILFSLQCTVYVLFYNFAVDLDSPFEGVYQIRRSSVASHLLRLKMLICNHPLTRGEVEFDNVIDENHEEVTVNAPGLGKTLWRRKDVFGYSEDVL